MPHRRLQSRLKIIVRDRVPDFCEDFACGLDKTIHMLFSVSERRKETASCQVAVIQHATGKQCLHGKLLRVIESQSCEWRQSSCLSGHTVLLP